jgi:hypothetical protein
MCKHLRKKVALTPERSIWALAVLQSEKVSRAVDEMERECIVVTQRVSGEGFFLARFRLRP